MAAEKWTFSPSDHVPFLRKNNQFFFLFPPFSCRLVGQEHVLLTSPEHRRPPSPPDPASAAFKSCLCNIKPGSIPCQGGEISWIEWRNKDFRGWEITSHCTVKPRNWNTAYFCNNSDFPSFKDGVGEHSERKTKQRQEFPTIQGINLHWRRCLLIFVLVELNSKQVQT